MPELLLAIADPALRGAINEQLRLAVAELELTELSSLAAPYIGDPAVLILDAALLDKKACKILDEMREAGKKTRIFLLGEPDAGVEIENGAIAESFPKPLRLGHLLARLQFHLQTGRTQNGPLVFGAFRLEPAGRQIVVEETGAVIRLTEKETSLLEYLGRSEKPVAREELLGAIWGYDARIDTHTLETHIYRLRRKLDPEGKNAGAILISDGAYCLADPPR